MATGNWEKDSETNATRLIFYVFRNSDDEETESASIFVIAQQRSTWVAASL